MTTTDIELTDEQRAAVDYCTSESKQVVRLGGYGGTGKSTVVSYLVDVLHDYAVCAYTGKAANVLRRKGITDARTIHSLIYKPHDVGGGQVEWELVSPHELAVGGFIVDEASMVSEAIHRDLLTFDLPLIYVGDHGQLEPVQTGGSDGFCLMRDPDVTLETIHRNAGEIARFAEWLRNGNDTSDWSGNDGQVNVITGDQISDCGMEAADQMICAYNRTRVMYNAVVRDSLGLEAGVPVVGDRIICLQNDREQRLFNGMQGTITAIERGRRRLTFADEDGVVYSNVRYNAEAFGSEKTPKRVPDVVPFDWAYCCTAHKCQGSEFDNVMVIEQRCDLWDAKRWNYTAASRAKRKLTWVLE